MNDYYDYMLDIEEQRRARADEDREADRLDELLTAEQVALVLAIVAVETVVVKFAEF